jgi:predicted hotdog family 3-hydroxylacyl-ACP dehydratase
MTIIDTFIPHRGPARWIDRLIETGADHALAECDVPAEGRLVHAGAMPAWAGIELMAQTVAAWAGGCAQREGRPVRLGFLLGTRRYQAACDGFASGSTLRISARREFVSDQGLGMFSCSIHHGSEQLAHAMVSVFEPAEAASFLGDLHD